MRIIMRILGVAGAALVLIACGSDTSGEACGDGTFDMTPTPVTACPQGTECGEGLVCDPDEEICKRLFERGVCYHSKQVIGGCEVWNYRIPPRTDFADYIDIFWGDGCDPNNFDGSLEESGIRYGLSGTPTTEPPTGPSGELMISGSYITDTGEQGSFDLRW